MNTNYIFNLLFNSLEYLVKIYGRMVQKMEYILINIIPTILAHTENTSKLYIVRFVNYRKKITWSSLVALHASCRTYGVILRRFSP